MHKIVIRDQIRATRAINWCKKHLDNHQWNIHTQWPLGGFIFSFDQIQDASWFCLHWAQ